jgi:hypothetical protein
MIAPTPNIAPAPPAVNRDPESRVRPTMPPSVVTSAKHAPISSPIVALRAPYSLDTDHTPM